MAIYLYLWILQKIILWLFQHDDYKSDHQDIIRKAD